MFAVLGKDIVFSTLTSPSGFRSNYAYTYAEHKVVEAQPKLQWIADELQTIDLDMSFHVAFTDPATEMNRLKKVAEDHRPLSLVFGNGVHRGYFVIEKIEETFVQTADDGSYMAITARVMLKEWVRDIALKFNPINPDPSVIPQSAISPPPGIVRTPLPLLKGHVTIPAISGIQPAQQLL